MTTTTREKPNMPKDYIKSFECEIDRSAYLEVDLYHNGDLVDNKKDPDGYFTNVTLKLQAGGTGDVKLNLASGLETLYKACSFLRDELNRAKIYHSY